MWSVAQCRIFLNLFIYTLGWFDVHLGSQRKWRWILWCARQTTCHYILLQHCGSSIVPRKWKEKKIIFALQSISFFKMSNLRDDRINSNCVILLLFPNRFNCFCHMSVRFSTQIQFSFNSVCLYFILLFFLFACHILCVVFVVKINILLYVKLFTLLLRSYSHIFSLFVFVLCFSLHGNLCDLQLVISCIPTVKRNKLFNNFTTLKFSWILSSCT